MCEDTDCPKCSHLRVDRAFTDAQEWISWIVENRIGEEGGILTEVYFDAPLGPSWHHRSIKCIECGQVFAVTAGKAGAVATWKPAIRHPPHG